MNRKNCPHCAEAIHPKALYCRYCRQQTFSFKIYMSDKEWFSGDAASFLFGILPVLLIGRVAFRYAEDEWRYSSGEAFIFASFCFAAYVAVVILIAYFYYQDQYQTELKRKIRENLDYEKHVAPYSETGATKTDSFSHIPKKKAEAVFKTSSVKETSPKDIQQEKTKPSDLTSVGFKVVKKSKD